MFDSLGNYLYCSACIRVAFEISKDRLTRQRNIKRRQSQQPVVTMTKSEIEQQDLSEFVVMPLDLEIPFSKWWRSQEHSRIMEVRMPHERHGNAGKISNSAKASVHCEFIEFVDMNSQPNGRSADSTGPTSYFLPKFATVQAPKPGISNYEQRLG